MIAAGARRFPLLGELAPRPPTLLIFQLQESKIERLKVITAVKKIDVDDEVFAYLQGEAVAFVDITPNDVLRRKLLGRASGSAPEGKQGDLMPLIVAGRLQVGDRLVHHQPRKRRTFTAQVTSAGYIQLADGRLFAAPSPALRACVGTEINGWYQWSVERTGSRLQDLRD